MFDFMCSNYYAVGSSVHIKYYKYNTKYYYSISLYCM